MAALLETGQTQCDDGTGTLGACPGSPPGQDGAVPAGAARSYTDNGDGTITDNVTGLMWEKLSNDGSIHDGNASYLWYDAFDKVAALNSGGGFAGYTDWRLPNVNELQSLVDYMRAANPLFGVPIDPVFHTGCFTPGCTVTTCSCTRANIYWSSTSTQDFPTGAWIVDFFDGSVLSFEKSFFLNTFYVRAVRGGS